ncbi:hypothetical protein [Spirulina subsalsa]|uniref:hypothetical protein n=1 Tax=Spirulina subsalsa TaxID=54311 RepID=UPI0003780CCA|nr:hypothetical protein [Spirulina subsalsa]
MTHQPNSGVQVCPACGVKIVGRDTVLFSAGAPGNRARLWARVCQYVKKPGCINEEEESIGVVKEGDYYSQQQSSSP